MRVFGAQAAVLVLGLAACDGYGSRLTGIGGNGGGAANPASDSVAVLNAAFAPAVTTIRPGGTVTWTWGSDTTSHNVTFANGALSSTTRSSGSHTAPFGTSGTFPYSCTIHPGMNGAVIVE